jgi:hypothetical protein
MSNLLSKSEIRNTAPSRGHVVGHPVRGSRYSSKQDSVAPVLSPVNGFQPISYLNGPSRVQD